MTKYNTLNVKLSNFQLIIRNFFSSNVIVDSNDATNFPHKLLLTDTQVSRLSKTFANCSSANIELSKPQVSKIEQSGTFLGRLLGPQ